MPNNPPWPEKMVERLRELWGHHSTLELASLLGVTKNALCGKANRLGLSSGEDSPIIHDPGGTRTTTYAQRKAARLRRAEDPTRPGRKPVPINTLPPLASLLQPLPVIQEPVRRRPEPPIRRHDVLPVSGIQAPSRPRVAYEPPMPPPPRPAVPTEPVEADWPTIRHWAAQRGLGDATLEVINAKRVQLEQAVFVVESWRRVA